MNPGVRLPTDDVGLELRLICIDDVPDTALSPSSREERERANRFRFVEHRRRYLLGRFMLRRMLADWSGISADTLRFGKTGNGKPKLIGAPDLYFNLSYAQDAVLIGVTRCAPIGVDVEARRSLPDAIDLAEQIFDAQEQNALRDRRCGTSESDLFLCGWTRKEACLKAVALGLSLDPASVSTGLHMASLKVGMAGSFQARVETMMAQDKILSWAMMI